MSSSFLKTLQEDCAGQLSTQEFFTNSTADTPRPITILTEGKKEIISQIQMSLARIGMAVIVMTPGVPKINANQKLRYESINVVVRVIENVITNRGATGTGQPAFLVAESCAWHLHHFKPTGSSNVLVAKTIDFVEDPEVLIYEVTYETMGGWAEAPQRQ